MQHGVCALVVAVSSSRAQQLVRRSRDEVTLLKRMLLQVIFGSSVDWSREEELCGLVVKSGLQS